jgi:hypothetical protein
MKLLIELIAHDNSAADRSRVELLDSRSVPFYVTKKNFIIIHPVKCMMDAIDFLCGGEEYSHGNFQLSVLVSAIDNTL